MGRLAFPDTLHGMVEQVSHSSTSRATKFLGNGYLQSTLSLLSIDDPFSYKVVNPCLPSYAQDIFRVLSGAVTSEVYKNVVGTITRKGSPAFHSNSSLPFWEQRSAAPRKQTSSPTESSALNSESPVLCLRERTSQVQMPQVSRKLLQCCLLSSAQG